MTEVKQYYIKDDATGEIKASGRGYIDESVTGLVGPGCSLVFQEHGDTQPIPDVHKIDQSGKISISTTYNKPLDKQAKIAELNELCGSAITRGFVSSALGKDFKYPSLQTDQTNMLHAAAVGGLLMASGSDGWTLRAHTVEQAQVVLKDFVQAKDVARKRLAAVMSKLTAATSQSEIDAITW